MNYKKFGVIKIDITSNKVNDVYHLKNNYYDKVAKLINILNNFIKKKGNVYIPLSNTFNNWCIGDVDIIKGVPNIYEAYINFFEDFDVNVVVTILYSEMMLEDDVNYNTVNEMSLNNSFNSRSLYLLKIAYGKNGVYKIDSDLSLERLINNGKVDKYLHKKIADQFELGNYNYHKQFVAKMNFQPAVDLEKNISVKEGTFSRQWKFPFNLDADNTYNLYYIYSLLDSFSPIILTYIDILYEKIMELNPDLNQLKKYDSRRFFKNDIINGCASGFKVRDMDYFMKYENFTDRPLEIKLKQDKLTAIIGEYIQFVCSPETLDEIERIINERNLNNRT